MYITGVKSFMRNVIFVPQPDFQAIKAASNNTTKKQPVAISRMVENS